MQGYKRLKDIIQKNPNNQNRLKKINRWFWGTGVALAFAIGISGNPSVKTAEYCSDLRYKQCLDVNDVAYCREEYCPDQRTGGENEAVLSSAGRRFVVIYPQSNEYSKFADMTLRDNILCYQRIMDYLGIEPAPLDTDSIVERVMMGDSPASYVGKRTIFMIMNDETWQGFRAAMPAMNERLQKGICSNSHEMTHLFLVNTPLYGWLNEGLATMMEHKVGRYIDGEDYGGEGVLKICHPDKLCHPTYCTYPSFVSMDYMNLSSYDERHARTLYYYTGMCFWHDILNEYGHQGLKRIMKELSARSAKSGDDFQANDCTRFIEMFEKALGRAIPQRILKKYGLGREMTAGNCTQK